MKEENFHALRTRVLLSFVYHVPNACINVILYVVALYPELELTVQSEISDGTDRYQMNMTAAVAILPE